MSFDYSRPRRGVVDEGAVCGHDFGVVSRLVLELARIGDLLGDQEIVDRLFLH